MNLESKIETFHTIYGDSVGLTVEQINASLWVSLGTQGQGFFCDKKLTIVASIIVAVQLALQPKQFVISVGTILFLYLYYGLFYVSKESLLLIQGLGYQVTRQYLLRETTEFIPYEKVQKIFINEVIYRKKVIFVLNLLIGDDKHQKLIPLFQDTLPKLDCLEIIYKHLKHFTHR